ncbi:hypothetical protein K3G69_04550 [Phytobacter diazotrophicus]|uniref:hypothetical protein n=1 Tax=Phytobacter diazotrophicus TaxID=395631 RepID=UPI001C995BBB|nr:hypothetical protein [Phytobacter diazotrophicus]MBY6255770.1 hypothetical protein [Phytobacter diazotrophicus]
MTIHGKKIHINLKSNTPDELTVANLKAQLTAIGLTCPDAAEDKLQGYINEVRNRMPDGTTMAFYIADVNPETGIMGRVSNANWSPEDSALGYRDELTTVGKEENFKWLLSQGDFSGQIHQSQTSQGKYDTVEAVKDAFVNVAEGASETLVHPLSRKDMEAALHNLLSDVNDGNVKNYDSGYQQKLFCLVENYIPETNDGNAIGVLGINWRLQVSDYKKKKHNAQHSTTIELRSWSVLYDKTADLDKDYARVKNRP